MEIIQVFGYLCWNTKTSSTMNESMKQIAIKYGVYLSLTNLAYLLYAYLIDSSVFTNTAPGIILFFVAIGFGIFAVGKFKQANGGYATFKEVFSTYILTAIVATLVGTAFTLLIFGLIDPEFGSEVMDQIVEKTLERFEGSGLPEDQVDEIIDRIANSDPFGLVGQLKSAAGSIAFNAIVGLIVGAAMKKNNPEL